MKRSLRKLVPFTLVLLVVVALCGGIVSGSAKDPVKLKHWVWLDNPTDPTFANMVKQFNETHPGIQVNLEVVAWGDFHTKLLTAATGGGLPDTSSFKLTWTPEFTGMDALQPLDGMINSWKGKADVKETLWDVMKVGEKKTFVMPWTIQVLYMYYRPSLFKEAGVQVPKTWDEFLEVAKKLTIDRDKDGKIDQYGFGMRGARGGHEPWGSFVFPYVKDCKIMDKGKVVFNTPEARKANEFFLDLYRKYHVVPPTAPRDGFAEIIANFKSGKTAMVVHHIMSSPDMVKTFGDDVSAFAVPAGPYGRWTSMGDTENALFKSSKHRKEAFTFIAWLAEKEQVDKWCRTTGNLPIDKSVQKLDFYQNNRFMKASFESMPYAHIYPATTSMGEWTEQIWPATTQQALEGKITGEQMMNTLAQAMAKK